jgi:hypothetical protein
MKLTKSKLKDMIREELLKEDDSENKMLAAMRPIIDLAKKLKFKRLQKNLIKAHDTFLRERE